MDSFEWNKVAGAALFALLLAFGLGIFSDILFETEAPETPGYVVAIAEPAEEGAGGEAPASQPIGVLLASADPAAGENSARKCAACHTFGNGEANKVGPNLWDIVERPIAGHAGYEYSAPMLAFAEQEQSWGYEPLNAYLADPKGVVPGTKMAFAGLRDDAERANVIAYLRTLSESPKALPEAEAAAPSAEAAAPEGEAAAPEGEAAPVEEEAAAAEATAAETAAADAPEAAPAAEPEALAPAATAASEAETSTVAPASAPEAGGDGGAVPAIEAAPTETPPAAETAAGAAEPAEAPAPAVDQTAQAEPAPAPAAEPPAADAPAAEAPATAETPAATEAPGAAEAPAAAETPAAGGSAFTALVAAADAAKGESFARRCIACHSFDEGGPNKVGPHLWGVVNRPVASVADYPYSEAMTGFSEGGAKVWDYDTLGAYLADPRGVVPGTKMIFPGIRSEADRANVVAYLRSLAAEPAPLPAQ